MVCDAWDKRRWVNSTGPFWAALAELADTEGLTHALDVADNSADWWPAGMTWRQTFGRFEPEGHGPSSPDVWVWRQDRSHIPSNGWTTTDGSV